MADCILPVSTKGYTVVKDYTALKDYEIVSDKNYVLVESTTGVRAFIMIRSIGNRYNGCNIYFGGSMSNNFLNVYYENGKVDWTSYGSSSSEIKAFQEVSIP